MTNRTLRHYLPFALLTAIILGGFGCKALTKRTKVDRVKLELFDGNREKLRTAFQKIEKSKTTENELKEMGFVFDSKNIEVYRGASAFRVLFGPDVFRDGQISVIERSLPELDRYALIVVPWKDVTEVSSRVYWNKKQTTSVGWDISFTIMLKDGVVVYKSDKAVDYNTFKSEFSLFGGPFELIREIGSPFRSFF